MAILGIIQRSRSDSWDWVALFLLLVAAAFLLPFIALTVLRRIRLSLSAEGFELVYGFWRKSVAWRDIEKLELTAEPSLVTWRLKRVAPAARWVARHGSPRSPDGTIPDCLDIRPPALLDQMQTYHAAHGGPRP